MATTGEKQWLFSGLRQLNWRSHLVSFKNFVLLRRTDFIVQNKNLNQYQITLDCLPHSIFTLQIVEGEHRRYFQRMIGDDAHEDLRYVNPNSAV